MVADTSVPTMVCIIVCFLRMTLDAAISGVKRNMNGKAEAYGKR